MRTGLDENMIAKLDNWEQSDLPESWKAALELADHLSGDRQGRLAPQTYDRLSQHFDPSTILMLGALLAVGSGWQTMIEAFAIRPDHYEPDSPGPWDEAARSTTTDADD